MADLFLILFNTFCGIFLIPKESKQTAIFLLINNETHCVSLIYLSLIFMTNAPSLILGKVSLEENAI